MQTTSKRQPEYVSLTEAAEASHTSRQGIHKLIQSKRLPAKLVGGRYIIPTKSFLDVMGKCSHCQQPRPINL